MRSHQKALAGALVVLGLMTASVLGAQPRAVVSTYVVDVGVVSRGDLSDHEFTIANEGDRPLEIVNVDPACGCTVVDYDRSIAPGTSGKLVATLNTKGMRGPISRAVQVFTNDKRNAQINLVIKANVKAYVDVEPGYARFLAVLGQGAEPVQQVVYSDEPGDLEVTRVSSPFPYITVTSREAAQEERLAGRQGRQWLIEMSLAEGAPEGSFADFVDVEIAHSKLERLRIPVSGFVQPVVAVLPRVADFGRKELKRPHVAVLEVKNLGEPDLTLSAVESSVGGLTPEIVVVDEGRLFRVRLTLDPSMPKGDFNGTLKILTSSSLQPEVTIDVRGTIL